jgi:hypothetical protein
MTLRYCNRSIHLVNYSDFVNIVEKDLFIIHLQKAECAADCRYGSGPYYIMEMTVVTDLNLRFFAELAQNDRVYFLIFLGYVVALTLECRSSRSRRASCKPFMASNMFSFAVI